MRWENNQCEYPLIQRKEFITVTYMIVAFHRIKKNTVTQLFPFYLVIMIDQILRLPLTHYQNTLLDALIPSSEHKLIYTLLY